MKSFKKVLMVLMVLFLFISVVGCSTKKVSKDDPNPRGDAGDQEYASIDTMERIKDSKKIIWGTNAQFSPFEMREGGEVIGIDAEIAEKIAEKLDVELEVEDMEFDSLMAALQSGKIDFIAAGFTIKPDREKQVLFTDTYFKAVQALIVKEGNRDIKSVEDLKGKEVGVQNGTTGDFEASDMEDVEVVRFNNGIEAALALNNEQIDAIIIDNLPAQMLVESNSGLVILDETIFDDEEYAMAVRKGDTELQQIINEVLQEMQDSGEIEELVNKYSIGQ